MSSLKGLGCLRARPRAAYLFDVRTELSLAASALLFRAVTGGGGCCWAGDGFPKSESLRPVVLRSYSKTCIPQPLCRSRSVLVPRSVGPGSPAPHWSGIELIGKLLTKATLSTLLLPPLFRVPDRFPSCRVPGWGLPCQAPQESRELGIPPTKRIIPLDWG